MSKIHYRHKRRWERRVSLIMERAGFCCVILIGLALVAGIIIGHTIGG